MKAHQIPIDFLCSRLNGIRGMSTELEAFIRMTFVPINVRKGDNLLNEGNVSNNLWFITKGVLRSYLPMDVADASDITTRVMTEGNFVVAVRSFYKNEPSYENIQAVTDCYLLQLSKQTWEKMHQQFPEVNFYSRVLTEEYVSQMALREYLLRHRKARERYDLFIKHFEPLLQIMPIKYLASFINVNRSTFTDIKNNKYMGGGRL